MLLVLGASFFVSDGVQTVAAGALRGLNDTRMPLLFAAVSFWGIGFASAMAGVPDGPRRRSASGSACRSALAVYAVLLVWRFHALTPRGYLPEVPVGA